MKLKQLLIPLITVGFGFIANAADVTVIMNNVSKTMTLSPKGTDTNVETGTPDSKNTYSFQADPGEYVLTAYASDGKTVNGSIALNVNEIDAAQEFKVITCTAYVTNKTDQTAWSIDGGDYTLEVQVNSKEGLPVEQTIGKSSTAGRNTFLALNGNSYRASFIPSEAHQTEGYMTLVKSGTLTANVNVNGVIPVGGDFIVTAPVDAEFSLGIKTAHFVDFEEVEPIKTEPSGDKMSYTYRLANDQMYFYRTWVEGGLTQGGYFKMYIDEAKCPKLDFAEADYKAFEPTAINHDPQSNKGYETGNIFVNVNPEGHLKMNLGDTFSAHAMRSWELTENSTSNNFIEPDFHYTVIGIDGRPSTGVIDVAQAPGSAWADIKAVGNGTAIVLVTYDAIGLNFYSNKTKTPYLGGEYWGAIWPENTAVYVVTVGDGNAEIQPNMLINEEYNEDTKKLAGKYVDAEHDVFYYLDTEAGYSYTFKPDGVENVTIAYPTIGERMATYTGFGAEGVSKNEDGSYTLLLKEGRQIVKLSDAAGNAAYQVLTAKACHREIVNASRPGSKIFQPGDQVKIQYSGLFHPANKLAGIYNMSAYVTYNGVPNGSSLILGKGQYTFASAPAAQAVTVDIPQDYDVAANPQIEMTEGVIQVNGFGDPIGNHRNIDRKFGRQPNFTAIAHKTYFGTLPDVTIQISAVKDFTIKLNCNVEGADITVSYGGNELAADASGLYSGTYGSYSVVAVKDGYRCYRHDFVIADDAEGQQIFNIEMEQGENAWDGKTLTEPTAQDGVYIINTGNELAWYANYINTVNQKADARLNADIDLGDFDWSAIGSSTKKFQGTFEGAGFEVKGLYIDTPKAGYQGLFGAVEAASIKGVTVSGKISGKNYLGGVAGYVGANSTIDCCVNNAIVTGTSSYVGGIVGSLSQPTATLTNCYNTAVVTGTTNTGGVVGNNNAKAVISNIFNIGKVYGTKVGACIGGTTAKTNVDNAFAVEEYDITDGHTLVKDEQMRSGEVAYKLGKAFGQEIGVDRHPVLGGMSVKYNPLTDTYYNEGTSSIDNIVLDDIYDSAVYYNLEGVASDKPFSGFNIVKLADGTTHKLYIK